MDMARNNFGYVLASKMLVNGRRSVGFMYHEPADDDQDSGWRFFCGEEDDDYVNNPDNIGVYDVSTILDIDGSIDGYLDSKVGMAFERNDRGFFDVVDDFVFGGE